MSRTRATLLCLAALCGSGLEAGVQVQDEAGPRPFEIQSWVRDLRDDNIRGNAGRARRRLLAAGQAAIAPLQRALGSTDEQQAQLASMLLEELQAPMSKAWIRVSLEGLADDELPYGRDGAGRACFNYGANNGSRGLLRLIRWGPVIWPQASAYLDSTCDQQRLGVALALAWTGCPKRRLEVTSELALHLGDNDCSGDALEACAALIAMGDAALPFLPALRASADQQARGLLDYIELSIRQPAMNWAEVLVRRERFGLDRVFPKIPHPAAWRPRNL